MSNARADERRCCKRARTWEKSLQRGREHGRLATLGDARTYADAHRRQQAAAAKCRITTKYELLIACTSEARGEALACAPNRSEAGRQRGALAEQNKFFRAASQFGRFAICGRATLGPQSVGFAGIVFGR